MYLQKNGIEEILHVFANEILYF